MHQDIKFHTKYNDRCSFCLFGLSKASMRTTLVDDRFLLLNPCCFGNLFILRGFSDRIHFHHYTLYIGRNPLHDVPVDNFNIRTDDDVKIEAFY